MVKGSKRSSKGKILQNGDEYIVTNLEKSVDDNLQERVEYWDKLDGIIRGHKNEIEKYEIDYESMPNKPEFRVKKADLRVKIERLNRKIDMLKRNNDQVDYISCIAKVFIDNSSENNKDSPAVTQKAPGSSGTSSASQCLMTTSGPLRQRMKKKRLVGQKPLSERNNVVVVKTIQNFVKLKENEKTKESKKLAELLLEIPVDVLNYDYCPICPETMMEFCEKPPAMTCPACGTSREILDINSVVVHDKETSIHIPFTYRPKLHFISWIKRITGQLRFVIHSDIVDAVRHRLAQRQIEHVDKVTWDVVNDVLHELASKVDKKYSDYYQHVYQITNIISGRPVLTLTQEQEQDLYNMFDVIFELWEKHKDAERSNFMSNALVLQLCFYILGYPDHVISMFSMLKGPENLRNYDRICENICKDLGVKPIKTAAISNMKCGAKNRNIIELTMKMKKEQQSNNPGLAISPLVNAEIVKEVIKNDNIETENRNTLTKNVISENITAVKTEAVESSESKKRQRDEKDASIDKRQKPDYSYLLAQSAIIRDNMLLDDD